MNIDAREASEITENALEEKNKVKEDNLKLLRKDIESEIMQTAERGEYNFVYSCPTSKSIINDRRKVAPDFIYDEDILKELEDNDFTASVNIHTDSMSGVEFAKITIDWK